MVGSMTTEFNFDDQQEKDLFDSPLVSSPIYLRRRNRNIRRTTRVQSEDLTMTRHGGLFSSQAGDLYTSVSESPELIRRKCRLKMEGCIFTIVANPPETSKDDSVIGSKNGQLRKTNSVTLFKRANSRKALQQGEISTEASSYAQVDLGIDKLPPVDAFEAPHLCSIRLNHILKRLENDDISKEDLIKNVKYASSVLETVYIDETRRLCDEDDELSEVEPDAVPSEVRDWLASTFTRSMSNVRGGTGSRPKFRSVANAVRAGIMVDRIYRRMSSFAGLHIPPNVLLMLKNLDNWSFDVFSLNDASDGNALKYVCYELLQRHDLVNKYRMSSSTLENFLGLLQQGYSKHKNPYHNLVHGADVAQTVYYVLSTSGLSQWLTDLELLATVFAAAIHDFEHTGQTNNFHIMTGSDVAMLYNDRAVLENHHISAAFRLLKGDDHNILANLSREEYREFRTLVIDQVLATDMSSHFQQIKNMKNLLSMPENIDKSKALSLILHCCDISHPAKEWALHHRWTMLLLEEFFQQGDREKGLGLPFSPLCDRNNTLVAQSQIGFIDFIVDPSFSVMNDMLDKVIASVQSSPPTRASDSTIAEERLSNGSTFSIGSHTSAPRSPLTKGGCNRLRREWNECLHDNMQRWKTEAGVTETSEEPKNDEAKEAKSENADVKPKANSPRTGDENANETKTNVVIKPLTKGEKKT